MSVLKALQLHLAWCMHFNALFKCLRKTVSLTPHPHIYRGGSSVQKTQITWITCKTSVSRYSTFLLVFCIFSFESDFHFIMQVDLELTMYLRVQSEDCRILLVQASKCCYWSYEDMNQLIEIWSHVWLPSLNYFSLSVCVLFQPKCLAR